MITGWQIDKHTHTHTSGFMKMKEAMIELMIM